MSRSEHYIPAIKVLACEEKAWADETHGPYLSVHEGWAHIHEEVVEAQDMLQRATTAHLILFDRIRFGYRPHEIAEMASELADFAINAACECIQIAACVQRFLDILPSGDAE